MVSQDRPGQRVTVVVRETEVNEVKQEPQVSRRPVFSIRVFTIIKVLFSAYVRNVDTEHKICNHKMCPILQV